MKSNHNELLSKSLIQSFHCHDRHRLDTRTKQSRKRSYRMTSDTSNNNSSMHPRNTYFNYTPNFLELAKNDEDLKSVLTNGGQNLDWDNPNTNFFLAKALMRNDYQLSLELPSNRLVPGIAGRENYVRWIEDLLCLSGLEKQTCLTTQTQINDVSKSNHVSLNNICGLDIGTGASCIYPLLGCRINKNWSFIATDIDDVSLQYALDNIDNNNLGDRIDLRQAEPHTFLIGNFDDDTAAQAQKNVDVTKKSKINQPILDFCMCNPPFFRDLDEASLHRRPGFEGALHEVVYDTQGWSSTMRSSFEDVAGLANIQILDDKKNAKSGKSLHNKGNTTVNNTIGGEVLFILGIIKDSLQLREKVTWYTSLVGKKSSLKILLRLLRTVHVTALFTTEFSQGRTCRWGIAWSFSYNANEAPLRLRRLVTRSSKSKNAKSRKMLSQYSAGTFLSPTAKSGHDLSNEENTYTKNGAIGSVERIFELPKDVSCAEAIHRAVECLQQPPAFLDFRDFASCSNINTPKFKSRVDSLKETERFFFELGGPMLGLQGSAGMSKFAFKLQLLRALNDQTCAASQKSIAIKCRVSLALPITSLSALNHLQAQKASATNAKPSNTELETVYYSDLSGLKATRATALDLKRFWIFVDNLCNDICRTSRKWRRKLKKKST